MNTVSMVGRLAQDPELRYTPNGVAVCSFSIAVQRRFTNENGEREADFFPCVAWRGLAETIAEYCRKGKQVAITGSLRQNRWQNDEGENRSRTEIILDTCLFLGSASDGDGDSNSKKKPAKAKAKAGAKGKAKGKKAKKEAVDDIDLDNLPF